MIFPMLKSYDIDLNFGCYGKVERYPIYPHMK